MKKSESTWNIEEVHGIWWAWFPPRPDDKVFEASHKIKPRNLIGPFHNKAFAEYAVEKMKGNGNTNKVTGKPTMVPPKPQK